LTSVKTLIFLCALLPCPVLAGKPLPGGVVARNDRSYKVQLPGIELDAGWSATVERDGKRAVLSSTSGEGELGPGSAIRFSTEGVELLLRLDYQPDSRTLSAQAGVRNTGTAPILLVDTTPVSAKVEVKGSASDWMLTGMHPRTPGGITAASLHEPLRVHECGGLYHRDGSGFFFGPAGTPIAYLNARFEGSAQGHIAMDIVADMSGVQVDPGETRWGQEAVLVLQPPDQAVSHWVGLVAASHQARTSKGALTGWNNGNPMMRAEIERELNEVTEAVRRSDGRLRLGVIQIEQVEGDLGNLRLLDGPWVPEAARRVAAIGARFGIRLKFASEDLATMAATVRRATDLGFNYLKVERPPGAEGREAKKTVFESRRAEFAAIRSVVGDAVYLSYCADSPDRAVVGSVDASRLGRPAKRGELRAAIDDVVLGLPLCGRWFAADFDDVYLGTWTKNESQVAGGWQQARMWLSLAGLAGGVVVTSDPLYATEFKGLWQVLESVTPPLNSPMLVPGLPTHGDRSRAVAHVNRDWGSWTLALLWNPSPGEASVRLDFAEIGLDSKAAYAVWGYWDNRLLGVVQGAWTSHYLRAPDFQLVRLTKLDSRKSVPTLIGSRLHVSCGGEEIKAIKAGRAEMSIELTGAGSTDGDLFVHSRFPPVLKKTAGCTVEGIALVAENIWRIRLSKRDLLAPQRIELAFLLPLTQQAWFWILVVAAGASMLFALWRYVVSLRLQRQQGLAEERSRIAQDLHDDLGANLAQIAYHGDSLIETQALAPANAGHVEKMRQIARTTTHALDEIVWAVDPKQDSLESFAGYLCGFAQEVLADAGLKCRFDFPIDFHGRPLSSKNRHHIFLACKEALHNVIRHASATEVRIRLAVGEKETELEIRDDGRGFDTSRATGRSGGGHGLGSMRDRLKAVGGRCEMTSHADAGTQLCFIWKTES